MIWKAVTVLPLELAKMDGEMVEAEAADGGTLRAVTFTQAAGAVGPGSVRVIQVGYEAPEPDAEGYRPARFPTLEELYSAIAHLDRRGVYQAQFMAWPEPPDPTGEDVDSAGVSLVKIGTINVGGTDGRKEAN